MKTKIRRWNDSLAIRIPRDLERHFGLRAGDEIEIAAVEGVIQLRSMRPRYVLESLLEQITPDKLHSETDWGAPCGLEF